MHPRTSTLSLLLVLLLAVAGLNSCKGGKSTLPSGPAIGSVATPTTGRVTYTFGRDFEAGSPRWKVRYYLLLVNPGTVAVKLTGLHIVGINCRGLEVAVPLQRLELRPYNPLDTLIIPGGRTTLRLSLDNKAVAQLENLVCTPSPQTQLTGPRKFLRVNGQFLDPTNTNSFLTTRLNFKLPADGFLPLNNQFDD